MQFKQCFSCYLQVLFQELLHGSGSLFLPLPFHRDGDLVALLDGQPHQLHQLRGLHRLALLGNGDDGGLKALGHLGQLSGGAGVDAQLVTNGMDTVAITWDAQAGTYHYEYLDRNTGCANAMHFVNSQGQDVIVGTNREIDEIALYTVTE